MTLSALTEENPTLSLSMVIIILVTLFFYILAITPSPTLTNVEPSFMVSWINGLNIIVLILSTLWFNLT